MINYSNSVIISPAGYWLKMDPYNPLNLPPNTIRVKYKAGTSPSKGDIKTLVDAENNIWDIYTESNSWAGLLSFNVVPVVGPLEILGANSSNITNMDGFCSYCSNLAKVALFDTSNVTNMYGMFDNCTSLTSIPLFDTSKVTTMYGMLWNCTSLTSVPLFDTSNVTYMNGMLEDCTSLTSIPLFNTSKVYDMTGAFSGCINVESGALALYQQASTQTTVPIYHSGVFTNCGSNTITGAAELAQIPSDWK